MVSDSSKRMALAGAAVAALGVAVYYKLKNDKLIDGISLSSFGCGLGKGGSMNIKNMTRKQLSLLLDEIIDNQKKMREMLKILQAEIVEKDLSFNEVCEQVEQRSMPSPLERYGLTVQMFSSVLSEHNGDANIREKIVQLTSGGVDNANQADNNKESRSVESLASKYSVETVIEVHAYMLERLKETLKNLEVKKKMHPRIATVAAQSYVGKLIQFQYGFSSEDLETLTEYYRPQLTDDERFFEMGVELRQALSKLTEMCTKRSDCQDAGAGGGDM